MKYSAEALAKLKAIQDHYKNTPKTPLPTKSVGLFGKPKTDVFGNPLSTVSPRVQRIRDLQAGKRVAPVKRVRLDWSEYDSATTAAPRRPIQQGINQSAQTVQKPTESYEDWTKRMESAMDDAADYLESK